MKLGDLVTLSAAGSNQDQNMIALHATFGMITRIRDNHQRATNRTTTYGCTKPLIEVQWFFDKKRSSFSNRKQHHWRYEIKKLKAKPKQ
jgi:hypothetical protein